MPSEPKSIEERMQEAALNPPLAHAMYVNLAAFIAKGYAAERTAPLVDALEELLCDDDRENRVKARAALSAENQAATPKEPKIG